MTHIHGRQHTKLVTEKKIVDSRERGELTHAIQDARKKETKVYSHLTLKLYHSLRYRFYNSLARG